MEEKTQNNYQLQDYQKSISGCIVGHYEQTGRSYVWARELNIRIFTRQDLQVLSFKNFHFEVESSYI
jgi:hypothetical protein